MVMYCNGLFGYVLGELLLLFVWVWDLGLGVGGGVFCSGLVMLAMLLMRLLMVCVWCLNWKLSFVMCCLIVLLMCEEIVFWGRCS